MDGLLFWIWETLASEELLLRPEKFRSSSFWPMSRIDGGAILLEIAGTLFNLGSGAEITMVFDCLFEPLLKPLLLLEDLTYSLLAWMSLIDGAGSFNLV